VTQHSLDVFGDVSAACQALAKRDKALRVAIKAIDSQPKIRRRDGGYAGLFRIIIEQQVSVPSAQAILARCQARIPDVSPQKILAMTEEELRACGLSGPKIKYVRCAAEAVRDGSLCFDHLASLEDDEEAAAYLCRVKGIGPWTAAIYQLFCEGRVDIWPRGDVALLAAYAAASGFETKPAMKDFDAMAGEWAPYRGIAAHILWTYYALLRGREPI
jgi:DNA-3-methyladenine glycosylase II